MVNGPQTSSQRWGTALALVAANLIPLVGVFAFGWDVASLLFVFWLESGVVGFFNVLRMAKAQGPIANLAPEKQPQMRGVGESEGRGSSQRTASFFGLSGDNSRQLASASNVVLIPFFLLHFGLFMGVHLAFLLVAFGPPRIPPLNLVLTTAALFASHGLSYVTYYLLRGEYLRTWPANEMQRPYGRIVVMHLTIILGALLVMEVGAPAAALAVMVAVKIVIDLVAHNRAHARYQAG
jgi:Family of unknown function (DUF6498)